MPIRNGVTTKILNTSNKKAAYHAAFQGIQTLVV
jgi:hypothetical protein